MKVEISKDKKSLIITAPLAETPVPSASGKTLVVASTRGNLKTDVEVNGQRLTIGLNAYIPKA